MNPLGLFLNPQLGLLTHLHSVYMAYSVCLPTRLTPLAERTCFSQVLDTSVVEGYPYADVSHMGMAWVAVADANVEAAKSAAR